MEAVLRELMALHAVAKAEEDPGEGDPRGEFPTAGGVCAMPVSMLVQGTSDGSHRAADTYDDFDGAMNGNGGDEDGKGGGHPWYDSATEPKSRSQPVAVSQPPRAVPISADPPIPGKDGARAEAAFAVPIPLAHPALEPVGVVNHLSTSREHAGLTSMSQSGDPTQALVTGEDRIGCASSTGPGVS